MKYPRDFTYDDMINASKLNYIYPMVFYDEVFLQISLFIPVIEDYYFISNYGRIFSCMTGRIFGTSYKKDGYEYASLKVKDGDMRSYSVHRLEMMCFQPIENAYLYEVNHKNGNKRNNHLSNLEWVTSETNLRHAYLTSIAPYGENHYWTTITDAEAIKICELLDQGLKDTEISILLFNGPEKINVIRNIRLGYSWKNVSANYNFMKNKSIY